MHCASMKYMTMPNINLHVPSQCSEHCKSPPLMLIVSIYRATKGAAGVEMWQFPELEELGLTQEAGL